MSEWTLADISGEEIAMVMDFITWAAGKDNQKIEGDNDAVDFIETWEIIAPYISEEADEFDGQLIKLMSLRNKIQKDSSFNFDYEDELPDDPIITPEKLKQFIKRDEVHQFFSVAGQMVERLSIDLILDEIIAESQISNSVKKKVVKMPQQEREWWLHVTGIISDGEKGEIRRVYRMRSSILHTSDSDHSIYDDIDIPGDIERSYDTVNKLHEKLHGVKLQHRYGLYGDST